jgi:hypothetical protein
VRATEKEGEKSVRLLNHCGSQDDNGMREGREGNGRNAVRGRLKADRAQDKKGDGRAVAAADARKRSNLLEGSTPFTQP